MEVLRELTGEDWCGALVAVSALHLLTRWGCADWTEDVQLELVPGEIVSGSQVDYRQLTSVIRHPVRRLLTAVYAAWPLNRAVATVLAVPKSAADLRAVPPHHLREVAPRIVVVGLRVGVQSLFFVPAVNRVAGELDPRVVVSGRRPDAREITTTTVLRV